METVKISKFWGLLKFLGLLLLYDRHLMKSFHISLLESQGEISSHFPLKSILMGNSGNRKCMKKKWKFTWGIFWYILILFFSYIKMKRNMLCILCLNFSWEFFCSNNYFLKNLFIVIIFQYMEIAWFHNFL